LKCEGELLNGQRDGKCKEYDQNGGLIFEGEYLKGKRWNGKSKEYDSESRLSFDGEYINGKKNGKCKEYYSSGEIRFEGDLLNGKKWNGKTHDKYRNKIYLLKNGQGFVQEYDNSNCLIYEGEYLNGERHGHGRDFLNLNQIYIDEDENLDEYFIEKKYKFRNDYYNNKLRYEGKYFNGKRWNGELYDSVISSFYTLREGKGFISEFYHTNRTRDIHDKILDKKLYDSLVISKQELFQLEEISDFRTRFYEFKKVEGEYINGEKNGKGKEYYLDGKIIFEGEYLNDKRWNGIKLKVII